MPTETPTHAATGHFLVIPQGYAFDLAGQQWRDVLVGFLEMSINYVKTHPQSTHEYWRPFWYVVTHVPITRTPAFGTEQYPIEDDGTLGPRLANWDSSD